MSSASRVCLESFSETRIVLGTLKGLLTTMSITNRVLKGNCVYWGDGSIRSRKALILLRFVW